MKIFYDAKVDSVYIELSSESPNGVIEVEDGINLDTTEKGKLVGIEILNASGKIDISTIMSYSLDFGKEIQNRKSA